MQDLAENVLGSSKFDVSVIIPTYNRGPFLARAVQSVARQDCIRQDRLEIIVVDDGSTDETPSVIKSLDVGAASLVYLPIPHCGEPGTVRNVGMQRAAGEFIGYCDSDDYWLPHHLATALQEFKKNPNLGLVSSIWGLARFRLGPGDELETLIEIPKREDMPPNTNTTVHRRQCLGVVGGFNRSRWGEDQDFFDRIRAAFPSKHLPIVTTINGYIERGNNITFDHVQPLRESFLGVTATAGPERRPAAVLLSLIGLARRWVDARLPGAPKLVRVSPSWHADAGLPPTLLVVSSSSMVDKAARAAISSLAEQRLNVADAVIFARPNPGVRMQMPFRLLPEVRAPRSSWRDLLGSRQDEPFFFAVGSRAKLDSGFLARAWKAFQEDEGLAAYGSTARRTRRLKILTTGEWRAGIRGRSGNFVDACVVRRSLVDQLGQIHMGDPTSWDELADWLFVSMARHFRVAGEAFPSLFRRRRSRAAAPIPFQTVFDELAHDYCAFRGISRKQIGDYANAQALISNAGRFREQVGTEFRDSTSLTQRLRRYYAENEQYVDELAYWHHFRYWDGWWTLARHILPGRFLEFGGGIATMSFLAARRADVSVDYFDISDEMQKFVSFRARRRGVAIKIIPVLAEPTFLSLSGPYDTICSIDVFEHIPAWKDTVQHLVSILRPGGRLIQHTNFGHSDEHPMHIDSDIPMREFLKRLGLRVLVDKYRDYDGLVWEKPV